MIKRYVKKPVEVEAIQWTGDNYKDIRNFTDEKSVLLLGHLVIPTLEGDHIASVGDYIIKGVKGEFYPCKPDIFEMTYTEVE